MKYSVRTLASGDIDALRGMLNVFGSAFDDEERYCGNAPDDAYLQSLVDGGSFIAVAAEVGSEVVGALAAYELKKLEQRRSEIYLYDLAVLEGWRRMGVATAMIDVLRIEASRRSADGMYVQADYGDDPAVALYTKLGTRADVMHFDIAVSSVTESE